MSEDNEYEDSDLGVASDVDVDEDSEVIDQYLDGDDSPLNIVQQNLPISLDPGQDDFHVVPDRVRSLEGYMNFLSESIRIGTISQKEFDNEILKTTYYLDTLTKKYNIVTEEKQKIIEDARILRKEAMEAYRTGAISEEKFNEVYTNAIRTEYSILKSSEIEGTDDSNGLRVSSMEDLTIEEKLEKLEKLEEKQIKSVAKKHKIKFPQIPPGKTSLEIDVYYKNKVSGILQGRDVAIERYIEQQIESKKLVDYHTTSFEVSKIFYNSETGKPDFEFKLVQSIRGDIEKIKRDDVRQQLLDPQEKAYVDRLNELKSMLRKMTKLDLIKCADVQLYELFTFIEKLRSSKQYVFRFKTAPNELDIEQNILADNEFYKLPSEKLLVQYGYTRPNVYTTEDTGSSSLTLNEIGNLGYLALKEGKNPLNIINSSETDIDVTDYVTVVPFQDELYSQLNSKNGNYTDIIEVWEVHLEFIDGSQKILRYTSFEDFLLVFKRLLINKCKILKKIDDQEVSDLLTNRSNIKYPRLKPGKAPFLLSTLEQKSYEEQRYEFYLKLTDTQEEIIPEKAVLDLDEKVSVKKTATEANTENDNTIKILLDRIMQIEYYLVFKMDKQQTLPTSQLSSRDILNEESEIYIMREMGLEKLINYISLTDPGAEDVIKDIESDIFTYSSKNYKFNIKKVIFIFDNFPEKMEDIILSKRSVSGQSTIKDLLVYETSNNLEAEKLSGIKTDQDKRDKIAELLAWNPDTSLYDAYEVELTGSNHNFRQFTKSHPEIRNIEMNQIMAEYGEKIQWKKSIENYNKLDVPYGMIELNFRLRFLLRNRNRLPSRRIFKLATISNRVERQEDLERTFGICKLKNYKKISLYIERIIYTLSKTPEDYMYYNYIINSKFKLICESLIALQESDIINEYDMMSILIKFIINNGDFSENDVQKLADFTKKITPENIELYISTLKRDELRAQDVYKISQIDAGENPRPEQDLYSDESRNRESYWRNARELELFYESSNKYVPPVIYNLLPDGVEKYFLINGQFICGGFYPPFYRWDENLIAYENYTRAELTQLSGIFAIPVAPDDTNYKIYEKIRAFIDEKESTPGEQVNVIRNRFNPEIVRPLEYLKIPEKAIMYTIRPRYGVSLPGEAYNVILDKNYVYGVPFKFYNNIPVYSSKLKEMVENRFVIIEGPSIYEDTPDYNFSKSNYYILIEYTDQRGLKVMFREGISKKKIIQKQPGYSACDRFNNQIACNDPNSYSLELKGKRYKCIWKTLELRDKNDNPIFKNSCVIIDDTKFFEDFEKFDISKVTFLEIYKQDEWNNAMRLSLKYIEDKIISEKLSTKDIDTLKKNQKTKLFKYYKKLFNHQFSKETGETTTASVSAPSGVHDQSLLTEFTDILRPNLPVPRQTQIIQEGYVKYTIYKHKKTDSVTGVDFVNLNENYNTYINGMYVNIIPIVFIQSENVYTCTTDDGLTIKVAKADIYKVDKETLKVIPIFCIVKKEDFPFLSNRVGYYWIHREKLSNRQYDQRGEPEIVTRDVDVVRYDVPSNFIEPTSNLPDLPIITRDNIFEAMYKTAFNTLSNSGNPMIYTTVLQFNATLGAKKFAVINRIDLKKIIKIGTIGIEDVKKMPEVDYVIKTITPQQILETITEAVDNKDVAVLSKYYLMGVKAEINRDILLEAKSIIDSYKKPNLEDLMPLSIKPPEESKNVVSYVIQRPGKRREEIEE